MTLSTFTRLILVRHGESRWNLEQRFTGWADVDLTADGERQMKTAGLALRQAGITLDLVYASVLRRCIRSAWLMLDAMDCMWLPPFLDWRLNERHYGALTGQSKVLAERTYGPAAVTAWRRSYTAQPPPVDAAASAFIRIDRRYAGLSAADLPAGESLQQTAERVQAVWQESIAPALRTGKTVAVIGHGNSLRALIKMVEGISDTGVTDVEVGNGAPIVYELDFALRLQRRHTLPAAPYRSSEIL